MKKKVILPLIKIVKINTQPQFIKMLADGVSYIHGSHSDCFAGLVRFRALLSMEEIDGTSWFDRNNITSGERGYTVANLYKNQPISQGVSMHYLQNYLESIKNYSVMRLTEKSYPVLYGLDPDVIINQKITEHPVSRGGINIDHIVAIYVPDRFIADAKRKLAVIPRLQAVVSSLLD